MWLQMLSTADTTRQSTRATVLPPLSISDGTTVSCDSLERCSAALQRVSPAWALSSLSATTRDLPDAFHIQHPCVQGHFLADSSQIIFTAPNHTHSCYKHSSPRCQHHHRCLCWCMGWEEAMQVWGHSMREKEVVVKVLVWASKGGSICHHHCRLLIHGHGPS